MCTHTRCRSERRRHCKKKKKKILITDIKLERDKIYLQQTVKKKTLYEKRNKCEKKRKWVEENLTSTVGERRGGEFAGSWESESLCDVYGDTEITAILERVAEAVGSGGENSFQGRAACPLRFGLGAVVGNEGKTIR